MLIQLSEQLKRFNNLTTQIESVYHDAARKLGLSDSEMHILYTICNFGECCLLSDICKYSGISKQTINSALRKLESNGIIYLKTYTGLKKEVSLTEKGKQKAKETVCKIIEIENEIFNSWEQYEKNQYIELTNKYLIEFKEKIKNI